MAIVVRPCSDTELHRACAIESLAYADNPLNPILFPGPFPSDSQQKRVDQLVQMRKNDSTAVFLQAIDTDSGRMIASAKWHVYSTPEETQIPIRNLEFGPGTNPEACRAFFGGMTERKEVIMGRRPHVCMDISSLQRLSNQRPLTANQIFTCCTRTQSIRGVVLGVR